jgi:protein gp37
MDWGKGWPNVWLGISLVNQGEADRDIPKLLATPARFRFLSMEPLLGPVDLKFPTNREAHEQDAGMGLEPMFFRFNGIDPNAKTGHGIDWVIVGGESGQHARLMQREWAISLRDQCVAAGVPFFFKQWGEWAPILSTGPHDSLPYRDGMVQFGKKRAGRLLDGREYSEYPAHY